MTKTYAWLLIGSTLVLGCDDDEISAADCAALEADDCASTSACTPILAVRLGANGPCEGTAGTAVGCMPAGTVCGEAISYAEDGAGGVWTFGSTCQPAAWTRLTDVNARLATLSCDGGETACATRALYNCEATPSCVLIQGRGFDEAKGCKDTTDDALGCRPREQSCTAAIVHARNQFSSFEFRDGCIPPQLTTFAPGNLVTGSIASWPTCDEVPAIEAACAAKSVADCKLDARCAVAAGLRVDRERKCLAESVEVGCWAALPQNCGDAYTIVADASGQPYWFGTTCVPANLTYLPPTTGTPQTEWASYERCE